MTESESPTHDELVEQAEAVLSAVEGSLYYPVAHGEAVELQNMIEKAEDMPTFETPEEELQHHVDELSRDPDSPTADFEVHYGDNFDALQARTEYDYKMVGGYPDETGWWLMIRHIPEESDEPVL